MLGRDAEGPPVRHQCSEYETVEEELGAASGHPLRSSIKSKSELVAKVAGHRAHLTSRLTGQHRFKFSKGVRGAWPNPSFKPSPNGKPPGPDCGALHSPQPGPGVSPLGPA